MKKNLIPYLVTVIVLVAMFFLFDLELLHAFSNISFVSIFFSVCLAYIINIVSGYQYYLIRKQYGISLSLKDVLLLPPVMGLWSFIFPLKGSLLFSTIFFKRKYNMRISESISISLYLYLITVFFTGVLGIIFAIINNMLYSWFGLISFFLSLIPITLILSSFIFRKIVLTKHNLLNKILIFFHSILDNIHVLGTNTLFNLLIIGTKIIHLILSVIWFFYISHVFNFDLSFFEVVLISLITNVSLIIKITPGNIGISQLFAGGFMALIASPPEKAIAISLFATASVTIISFTLGLIGNFFYFNTLNILKLKSNLSADNNTQ